MIGGTPWRSLRCAAKQNEQFKKHREETLKLRAESTALQNKIAELRKQVAENSSIATAAENTILQEEVKRLRKELDESRDIFFLKHIAGSDYQIAHFTGLPNRQTYAAKLKLFDGVEIQYVRKWKVTRFSKETQLFMTLLKLRRNLTNLDLAVRFNVGTTTVSNVVISWVMALHHFLVKSLMYRIPSLQKNKLELPDGFKDYSNTRIILDCTEVSTANPGLISDQCTMYSSYKHRITSKGLVGIAPNGTVTFVSKLYAGSTSDRNIVINSGVLNALVPGDGVMADKGFNISDLMPDGVILNIPPFKETPQFTVEQINETKGIARARIHVERAIARIKRLQILSFIPHFYAPYASEIFQVCAALTNFQPPLIKDLGGDADDDYY